MIIGMRDAWYFLRKSLKYSKMKHLPITILTARFIVTSKDYDLSRDGLIEDNDKSKEYVSKESE